MYLFYISVHGYLGTTHVHLESVLKDAPASHNARQCHMTLHSGFTQSHKHIHHSACLFSHHHVLLINGARAYWSCAWYQGQTWRRRAWDRAVGGRDLNKHMVDVTHIGGSVYPYSGILIGLSKKVNRIHFNSENKRTASTPCWLRYVFNTCRMHVLNVLY